MADITVTPSGVSGAGEVSSALIWSPVDTDQTPDWGDIDPSQTPGWTTIPT